MDDDQQFCLRWNNHQSTLISVFDTLLENETLVDCTLAAEGKFLKAHKVVLSACSPYFATLLQEQYDKHPIFILKDVKYQELRAMMDYMYRGEVNISQDQLAALLKAAESLQIKGLSDNRTGGGGGGGTMAPKPDHHRVPLPTTKLSSGYTLEQTKRARIAGPPEPEIGSREGSSSPSRRRRKVRRRSIENAMTDVHDNSNSSQQHLQPQSNASGLGAITAAASALAAAAAAVPNQQQSLASNIPLSASTSSSTAVTATGTTLSSSKKTDNVKGTTQQQIQQQQHDAMNTENAQGPASAITATGSMETETTDAAAATTTATDKSNHKHMQQKHHQQVKDPSSSSDLVIEPKAEYDDEANEEPVEDLTLDEEDMGMDDLDQNAGTSQGGEGSSQGYAPWQHDRSQDELLLATQEAQQRDPQDLTKKLSQIYKENTAPNQVAQIQKTNLRSILNNDSLKRPKSRSSLQSTGDPKATSMTNNKNKRLSASDVSEILFEFYRAGAKAPRSQGYLPLPQPMAFGATAASMPHNKEISPTSAATIEPAGVPVIATTSADSATASKNLTSDEMMTNKLAASFHPSNICSGTDPIKKVPMLDKNMPIMTSIPTSVVVQTPSAAAAAAAESLDIKPLINPATGLVNTINPSVIKPVPVLNTTTHPQAAAMAAALLCDGYQSLQQQMCGQALIKYHTNKIDKNLKAEETSATNFLEQLLRQQRNSECDTETASASTSVSENNHEIDDDDDSRNNAFEDIELMESSKPNVSQLLQNVIAKSSLPSTSVSNDYYSDESHKYLNLAAQAQAQALMNLEFSMGDFNSDSSNAAPTGFGPDGEPVYECSICKKKYRWKSTLRRHEKDECGGKEPSHQCPYCTYKSKQRGNLGVHVRKHHQNLPQLASKRRSKYSMKLEQNNDTKSESNPSSTIVSDDSNSKLIIDCSK